MARSRIEVVKQLEELKNKNTNNRNKIALLQNEIDIRIKSILMNEKEIKTLEEYLKKI